MKLLLLKVALPIVAGLLAFVYAYQRGQKVQALKAVRESYEGLRGDLHEKRRVEDEVDSTERDAVFDRLRKHWSRKGP